MAHHIGSAAPGRDNQRGGNASSSSKNRALPRSVTTGCGHNTTNGDCDLHQSCDFRGTPRLSFDAWTTFIRSSVGDQAEVAEPRSFAAWVRPLNLCGLAGSALKIECWFAATDSGRYAYRSERRQRDVRLVGADWYYAVFQLAGRSALVQNDRPCNSP